MTGKHPTVCTKCEERTTYRANGVCRFCEPAVKCSGRVPKLLPVAKLPEAYLLQCAAELAERHRIRAVALAKIGITVHVPEAA